METVKYVDVWCTNGADIMELDCVDSYESAAMRLRDMFGAFSDGGVLIGLTFFSRKRITIDGMVFMSEPFEFKQISFNEAVQAKHELLDIPPVNVKRQSMH